MDATLNLPDAESKTTRALPEVKELLVDSNGLVYVAIPEGCVNLVAAMRDSEAEEVPENVYRALLPPDPPI